MFFTSSLKEENDVGEFFLTLEKDPQQEDFLQGRMQGNPYRSILIKYHVGQFQNKCFMFKILYFCTFLYFDSIRGKWS